MSWDYDDTVIEQSSGVYINPKDIVNHLLLVWSVGYLPPGQAPTKFNEQADCAVVDVVDLSQVDPDTGLPGLLATGQRWYQARLIRELKPRVGRTTPMLCAMTQVPSTKGNPAFELTPAHHDESCVTAANEWRARNRNFIPGAARQTQVDTSTPAPAQYVQPPAVPATAAPATPAPARPPGVMDLLRKQAAEQQASLDRLVRPQQPEPPF